MTKYRIPLALTLLLAPVLIRGLWFYQGVFLRGAAPATPDFLSYAVPQPPVTDNTAPVSAASATGRVVLVDQTHGNRFTLSELEALTGQLAARGARVEPMAYVYDYSGMPVALADRLKYASAFVTASPMTAFSPDEVRALREFAGNGGRILVLTDPTRYAAYYDYSGSGTTGVVSDTESANTLLAPFGLSVTDDFLFHQRENEGNFLNVFFRSFAPNALTDGLREVVLYSAHSVSTQSGTILLTAVEGTSSSLGDDRPVRAAAALDASGRVLAIGDFTFLASPYNRVADNAVFIARLADFLLPADRRHTLADFPFLFRSDVSIVPAEDVTLDSGLFQPLRSLQLVLQNVGVTASVRAKADPAADRILLATYQSADAADLLRPFGIRLPGAAADPLMPADGLQIDGFGAVDPAESGLILYLPESNNRTTVVLIAQDTTALIGLLMTLGSSGFSECIVQGPIGVCAASADSLSTDYWDSLFDSPGFSEPALPVPAG